MLTITSREGMPSQIIRGHAILTQLPGGDVVLTLVICLRYNLLDFSLVMLLPFPFFYVLSFRQVIFKPTLKSSMEYSSNSFNLITITINNNNNNLHYSEFFYKEGFLFSHSFMHSANQ